MPKPKRSPSRKISPETKKKIAERIRSSNKSLKDIAKELNVSEWFVKSINTDEGIRPKFFRPRRTSPALRKKVAGKIRSSNKSLKDIAKELNVSEWFVKSINREEGIRPKDFHPAITGPETVEKIVNLLKSSNKTVVDIAKECKVSNSLVSKINRSEEIRPKKGYASRLKSVSAKDYPEYLEVKKAAIKALKASPFKPIADIAKELGVSKKWLAYINVKQKIRSKYENLLFAGGSVSPVKAFRFLREKKISEKFFSNALKYSCQQYAKKAIAKRSEIVKWRKPFFEQELTQRIYDWIITKLVSKKQFANFGAHVSAFSAWSLKVIAKKQASRREVPLKKARFLPEEKVLPKHFPKEKLLKALKVLSPREKQVIKEIFFKSKTQTQIAKELGLTKSAISRNYIKALKKLRKKLLGKEFASISCDEAKFLTKIFKEAKK